MDAAMTGAIVLAALGIGAAAMKLAQALAAKIAEKGGNGSVAPNGASTRKIENLWDIVSRCDGEGTPMIYFPRRALLALNKIAETSAIHVEQTKQFVASQEKVVAAQRLIVAQLRAQKKKLAEIKAEIEALRKVWEK